eukprot:TRINITY_DN3370_c0_g1_i1.p1 TRINITY_DN3370_c0_g1~~TRINITY_DN3370_c0_g1_i1.p1  ORF type:complete len:272 (-),score=53.49 TRINITY_DN3370_c0_g1_i1:29-844(-)
MICKASKEVTSDKDGIEILANDPIVNADGKEGYHTKKIIHLQSKLPYWAQKILTSLGAGNVLQIEEQSWNFYPYTKTIYRCPLFGDRCKILVETIHKQDKGQSFNVHNLKEDRLAARTIEFIDITSDDFEKQYYKKQEDPKYFRSLKTNRGPLKPGWKNNTSPVMCAYKLVTVDFNLPGLRKKVEKLALDIIKGIYLRTHRQAWCWVDEWYDLNSKNIKILETEVSEELTKHYKNVKSKSATQDTDENNNVQNSFPKVMLNKTKIWRRSKL